MRRLFWVTLVVFIAVFVGGSLSIQTLMVNTAMADEAETETFNKYKQIIIEDTKRREKERETTGKEWHEGLNEVGRFQFHSEMPFILDTKKGHVWLFNEEDTALKYMGQVLPWKD